MKYVAIDCETYLDTMQFPDGTPVGRPPKPVCWGIDTGGDPVLLRSTEKIGKLLTQLLEDPNTTLVGQNIPFDLSVAWKWLGVPIELIYKAHDEGRIKDTFVRELLIDTVTGMIQVYGSYSLDQLLLRNFNIDKSHLKKGDDIWRLRYNELDGVPIRKYPDDAASYAIGDPVDTRKLFMHQEDRLERVRVAEEEFQTLSSWSSWMLGCQSPFVDSKRVKVFKKKHKKIVARLEKPLAEGGLLRWNKNRYKDYYPVGDPLRGGYSENRAVMQAMIRTDYERQGLDVPMTKPSKTFPDGQVKYDADTLLGCNSIALREYGRTAKDRKLVNAFVPMLEQNAGKRVMPMYNVLVSTGRMSCRRPNMQQLPRAPGARECFIPPPGKVIACLDYDSFEMFGLAQVLYRMFGETFLLETLNARKDPHLIMVAKLLGESYKKVVRLYHAEDEYVGKLRQLAKIINFGAGGGMGAPTFLKNMDEEVRETIQLLDPDEDLIDILKAILSDWRDTWNMHGYFAYTAKRTRHNRKYESEQLFNGRIRGNLGYTDGNNERFQGICADGFKNQMNQVMREIMVPGHYLNEHEVEYGGVMHDENMMMGWPDNLRKWTNVVKRIMIEKGREVMPDCELRADVQVTGDRWMKSGITVPEFEQLAPYSHDVESFILARKENKQLTVPQYLEAA